MNAKPVGGSINYKLALVKSVRRLLNNNRKGICNLPLRKIEFCAAATAALQHPRRGIQGELCAPGKLTEGSLGR